MADYFSSSVQFGLNLSKRIYYGKGSAPSPVPAMSRSPEGYLPTAPMCYAVISDPEKVENPDIPSYQPYVLGQCEPPALIPLQLHGVAMEVDCCLDTAFVTVTGKWRVHCVASSSTCDCQVAIPMGEQGSLLGLEVDGSGISYHTEFISLKDEKDKDKVAKAKDGYFLKSHIYTIKIPQFRGGSVFSVKIRWSQKILFHDGQLSLCVPFSFPSYVDPVGKRISKKEKIFLKVNSGAATDLLWKTTSHPLKELFRQAGKLKLSYEAEVLAWSSTDFSFSYTVTSNDIFGGVLLQSPFLRDFDEREIFCLYIYPGNRQDRKVFRKDAVFIVDISASMKGSPLENIKNALLTSLSQLNAQDTFNIIAFNGAVYLFSSSMETATEEAILNATKWVDTNFIANGDTNIMLPLTQAMKLLEKSTDSVPLIFLVTDGAVEDEREICNFVKSYVSSGQSVRTPRICTFGIGKNSSFLFYQYSSENSLYCNHYFLQMLAQIGRGHYDSAHDLDSIDFRMQRLFSTASSVIVADITIEGLEGLDSHELFPTHMQDLSFGSPLILSGRYSGTFPELVEVTGTLADMTNFVVDLKVKREKDMQLSNVLSKRHIDLVTAQAWLLKSEELEEKVSKMSIQNKVPSEYTCMNVVVVQSEEGRKAPEQFMLQKAYNKLSFQKLELDNQKLFLRGLSLGFGDLKATSENLAPAIKEAKPPEGLLGKAASTCCGRLANSCCGMCLLQTCTFVNDQCTIVCTQLCAALACFELIKCCVELCECDCL
ncbi:Inter-alpha-trypsin inhibitor heavy chain H5 [Mucuna pruriens]|uniref:Inter-alpha-trypsin inhibitor heavy chain H5 n=1 Tax=Mucuna pruriens TaxID=157652 RepID=A0A371ESQ8_MUCPR|nr:Inter-alpha-trypsin inhibitor heavy chain H5 [Mucuna pruriens]